MQIIARLQALEGLSASAAHDSDSFDLSGVEHELGGAASTATEALQAVESAYDVMPNSIPAATSDSSHPLTTMMLAPHTSISEGVPEHAGPLSKADETIASAASQLLTAKRLFRQARSSGRKVDAGKATAISDKIDAIDQQLLQLRSKWGHASEKAMKTWVRTREMLTGARLDALASRVFSLQDSQTEQDERINTLDASAREQDDKLANMASKMSHVETGLVSLAQQANQEDVKAAIKSIQEELRRLAQLTQKIQHDASLGGTGSVSQVMLEQLVKDRQELAGAKTDIAKLEQHLNGLLHRVDMMQGKLASLEALRVQVAEQTQKVNQLASQNSALEQSLADTRRQFGETTDSLIGRVQELEQTPHRVTLQQCSTAFEPLSLLSRCLEQCCAAWSSGTNQKTEPLDDSNFSAAMDSVVGALRTQVEDQWTAYAETARSVAGPLGWVLDEIAPEIDGTADAEHIPQGGTILNQASGIVHILNGLVAGDRSILGSHILLSLLGSAVGASQAYLQRKLSREDAARVTQMVLSALSHHLLESDILFDEMSQLKDAFWGVLQTRKEVQAPSDDTALGRVACVACNRPASTIAPPSRPHSRTLRTSPDLPPARVKAVSKRPQSAAPVLRRARASTFETDSRGTSPLNAEYEVEEPFSMGGGFRVKPNKRGISYSAQNSPDIDLQAKYQSMKQSLVAFTRPASAHFDSRGKPSLNAGLPPGKVRHMAQSPGHSGMTLQQSKRVHSFGGTSRRHGGVQITPGITPGVDLPSNQQAVQLGASAFALPTIWTAGQFPVPDEFSARHPHDPVILSPAGQSGVFGSTQLMKSKARNFTADKVAINSGLGRITGWASSSHMEDE